MFSHELLKELGGITATVCELTISMLQRLFPVFHSGALALHSPFSLASRLCVTLCWLRRRRRNARLEEEERTTSFWKGPCEQHPATLLHPRGNSSFLEQQLKPVDSFSALENQTSSSPRPDNFTSHLSYPDLMFSSRRHSFYISKF